MEWITLIERMMPQMLMVAAPIMIAGLGGIMSERSGIVNIALEGIMLFGAFAAASIIILFESFGWFTQGPWLALIIAAVAGGIFSLVLALSTITFSADHTIAGTAVNLLAAGITVYLTQIIFKQQRTVAYKRGFRKMSVPFLKEIPLIGGLFTNIYPTIFIALVLVAIIWFVLFKTAFGLRLRSCGENPHASASMGIDVIKTRYAAVFISGILAGLAGGVIVLTVDTQFTAVSIHGLGFIAVAAVIFGKWNPIGLLGASLFFGLSQTIGVYASDIPIVQNLPTQLFSALPYALTVIALVVFRGKSVGPKAVGEIYDVSKR
ncbi:MAG TPA: ABC transporter permease [Erysipelotrichaceae bacterium]|nr:ABC transporter permease [Erysipelotrichaceae bacterium]